MIVELIARTTLVSRAAVEQLGYTVHDLKDGVSGADELAEVAGRECYQSWNRPNPGTASNGGYLANILSQGHFSVLEHASFTFSIRDVSRSLTHELIRHRHLSPSQVSQRYVDESHGDFIIPPEIVRNRDVANDILLTDTHHELLEIYNRVYTDLVAAGVPRKRARQAARYILPNGHATRLILSGNVRAWREMISKRIAINVKTGEPAADLEFYELAKQLLFILHQEVPNSVQDLWEQYIVPVEVVNG